MALDYSNSLKDLMTPEDANEVVDALEMRVTSDQDEVQAIQTGRMIDSIKEATGFDMVREYWINSILSGIKTQVANITGNSLNFTWEMGVKRMMEASINTIAGKYGDKHGATFGEIPYLIKGAGDGIQQGLKNFFTAFQSGVSPFEVYESDIKEIRDQGGEQLWLAQEASLSKTQDDKYRGLRGAIPAKWGGGIVRFPTRLLLAMDEAFKAMTVNMEMQAQSYRIAKAEGLKGAKIKTRMNEILTRKSQTAWVLAIENSRRKAEKITFQERHAEGTPEYQMIEVANKVREMGWGLGNFVIPFVNTPFNIFLQGFQKSPLGVMRLMWMAGRQGLHKMSDGEKGMSYGKDQFISQIADSMLSIIASGLLYGMVEGDDDDDEKPLLLTSGKEYRSRAKSEHEYRTGKGSYRLRAGDVWIDLGRLEPLSKAFGSAVDMIHSVKVKGSPADLVTDMGGSLIAMIEATPFVQGIGSIIEAMKSDYRMKQYPANLISSFVPNIIRQTTRESLPHYTQSPSDFVGMVKHQATGGAFSEPKIDFKGKPVKRGSDIITKLFYAGNIDVDKKITKIDNTVEAFNLAVERKEMEGEEVYYPRVLSNIIRHEGESLPMNPQQFRKFAEFAGRIVSSGEKTINLNVKNPTTADIQRIKNLLTYAMGQAKARILPELLREARKK